MEKEKAGILEFKSIEASTMEELREQADAALEALGDGYSIVRVTALLTFVRECESEEEARNFLRDYEHKLHGQR